LNKIEAVQNDLFSNWVSNLKLDFQVFLDVMRFFRKLFIYGCLLLITFLAAVVSLTYFYQDQIIQQFVAQANQYLKTPVKVRQITLSAFEKFPHIALTFDDLVMYEGIEGSTDTLLPPILWHLTTILLCRAHKQAPILQRTSSALYSIVLLLAVLHSYRIHQWVRQLLP
jgi:hypothetical protein